MLRVAFTISLLGWITLLPTSVDARGYQSDGEREVYLDAVDGQLDNYSLLEASLIVSGVDIDSTRVYLERFESICEELQGEQLLRLTRRERARKLLKTLHEEFCHGQYYAPCARVDQAFTTGKYNCVTATILYYELCRRCQLACTVVSVPGHVYARVHKWDVQTTSATWLDQPRVNSFTQSAPQRSLTSVQLLAKLFYNRGVARIGQQDFRGAIQILQSALCLDPQDAAAAQNLIAAMNNWALRMCEAGKYRDASVLIHLGMRMDPEFQPLQANDAHVHQQWALALVQASEYRSAANLLEGCYDRRPNVPAFREGLWSVYRVWLGEILPQRDDQQIREICHRAVAHQASDQLQRFLQHFCQDLERARSPLAAEYQRHLAPFLPGAANPASSVLTEQ